MIQEILDFYFEARVSGKNEDFVTKDYLHEKVKDKLDRRYFEDHVKR
jgi:hypothetical protein